MFGNRYFINVCFMLEFVLIFLVNDLFKKKFILVREIFNGKMFIKLLYDIIIVVRVKWVNVNCL